MRLCRVLIFRGGKRDYGVYNDIKGGIELFSGKNRGRVFDIEISGGMVLHKYTCEFRELGVCSWNQVMVMDVDGIRYHTLLNVNIKVIASEHGWDNWEAHLVDRGFFYITGDVDLDEFGKVCRFNVVDLYYKSCLMVNNKAEWYKSKLL